MAAVFLTCFLFPCHDNPAKRIGRYREHRRERFLTSEELARLGDVLREGETEGLPWRGEHESKHMVKEENRRTMLDPFAAAAIRLLTLTGARLREILELPMGARRFRARHSLSARQQDGPQARLSLSRHAGDPSRPATARRQSSYHRGHEGRRAARGFEKAMGSRDASGQARRRPHSRFATFVREHRRRSVAWTSDHRQAFGAFTSRDNASLCTPRRGPDAAGGRNHRGDDSSGHGRCFLERGADGEITVERPWRG